MAWTKRSKIYCVVWTEVDFACDKTLSVECPEITLAAVKWCELYYAMKGAK